MTCRLSCCVVLALAAAMVAGCLPSPIGDPTTSTIDAALEGTWLHAGLELDQCRIGEVEYGPGRQQTIYLVKAFDEHCYLVTAIAFYAAKDGRLGTFGPGSDAGLSWSKAWLAPLGDRRYLVCQNLPADPLPTGPAPGWFPTFELERPDAQTVRLTPVVFGDLLQRLEGLAPAEAEAVIAAEYSREKLEARIREHPADATPGDPRPLLLERMNEASRPLVERVLAAYHILDLRRARQPEPADTPAAVAPAPRLDGPYDIRTIPEDLTRPTEFSDTPGPGKVVMDQIANPKFFPSGRPASPNALQGHAVYLPTNWEPGKKYPVVFEYLGNTVGVQSLQGIGYGITGGRDFIWVILPIVSEFPATQPDVTVNWGAGDALSNTVAYAKQSRPASRPEDRGGRLQHDRRGHRGLQTRADLRLEPDEDPRTHRGVQAGDERGDVLSAAVGQPRIDLFPAAHANAAIHPELAPGAGRPPARPGLNPPGQPQVRRGSP